MDSRPQQVRPASQELSGWQVYQKDCHPRPARSVSRVRRESSVRWLVPRGPSALLGQ